MMCDIHGITYWFVGTRYSQDLGRTMKLTVISIVRKPMISRRGYSS